MSTARLDSPLDARVVEAPAAHRERQHDAPEGPRGVGLLLAVDVALDGRHVLALLAQDLHHVPGGAAGPGHEEQLRGTRSGVAAVRPLVERDVVGLVAGAARVIQVPDRPRASKRAVPGCQRRSIDFIGGLPGRAAFARPAPAVIRPSCASGLPRHDAPRPTDAAARRPRRRPGARPRPIGGRVPRLQQRRGQRDDAAAIIRASSRRAAQRRATDPALGAEADPVQFFVTAIQHPIQFAIAAIIAGGFVLIFLRAAMSPERESGSIGWVRAITGPSTRYLFAFLAIVWVVGFGLLIPQFPNTAASPYGVGRPDRHVQRLLHHDGAALERHRRVADPAAGSPASRPTPRRRRGVSIRRARQAVAAAPLPARRRRAPRRGRSRRCRRAGGRPPRRRARCRPGSGPGSSRRRPSARPSRRRRPGGSAGPRRGGRGRPSPRGRHEDDADQHVERHERPCDVDPDEQAEDEHDECR